MTDFDLLCMHTAINEARNCRPEEGRVDPPPLVGAVLAANGRMLGKAYRGEREPGEHAEYLLLEHKLRDSPVAGATVYTTLEPCTKRNHPKMPCVERLIARKIGRVVIGTLDPDQDITGRAVLRLRQARTHVELFPPHLMEDLEDLNREFTANRESCLRLPARLGYRRLDQLVPRTTSQIVMVGQNLASRLGMDEHSRAQFLGEFRGVLQCDHLREAWLVMMPPEALRAIHPEAAEDLGKFSLPALEGLVQDLGHLAAKVRVAFHPAATLSLLAIDGRIAYVTPKFQKTAELSKRLTIRLDSEFFDSASLDRMLYEAKKEKDGARCFALVDATIDLRNRIHAGPQQSHSSAAFEEIDGVFWKRRPGGGYYSKPRCPSCPDHPIMGQFPPGAHWVCSVCDGVFDYVVPPSM